MCGFGRDRSSSASSTSSDVAMEDGEAAPFRLLDLPSELVLLIVYWVQLRPPTELFPCGPSSELLALSETSTLFLSLCRPHAWRSLSYAPPKRSLVRPATWQRKRGLRALLEILSEASVSPLGLPQIECLQVTHPGGARNEPEEDVEAEHAAFVTIIETLTQSGLRVLFLKSVYLAGPGKAEGDRLVQAIARSTSLTAVRFNQVEAGNEKLYSNLALMPNLKTLQIMHGQRSLLEFARLCPNVESLLMWPDRRRFGTLMPVIASRLGSLKFLSLDAVSEPACFDLLTSELQLRKDADLPTPLEELFLEGSQSSADRSTLLAALPTTLKRLALYHLHKAKPALIAEIANALPNLEGLTLVQGDTSEAVLWSSPLTAYVDQLRKLEHLKFFAFDRRSPATVDMASKGQHEREVAKQEREFATLSEIGVACKKLETAVAILLDVSQGAVGYFAEYHRIGAKVQMDLNKVTVQDFLIAFNRWCICPLYVLNGIFPSSGPAPSKEDTIGAISAIIWSITLIPLVKYAWIALEFGNRTGEGGPFAVYTALYPPPEETDEARDLTHLNDAPDKSKSVLERPLVKGFLYVWVLFATCLTISDGLLTPAVSVVSAVEGLAVGAPKVGNSIVGISCAILVVLFIFQFLGTRRVGFTFSPIVAIWLLTLAVSGIINITHFPGVFRAFDPSRGIMLFVRTGDYGLLGGVLLAITGVEAMFANLGQFSKASIRLGFSAFAYPCLILAYLGQGARLITDGDVVIAQVFFNSIPGPVSGGFWWFTWIISVLAAVIASQAMISATFSLVQQLTGLHAMPAFSVIHTDDSNKGQVFAPAINILICIGTIGVTAGFGTDIALTNAYGFAVSGVLFITTSMLAISMVRLKHLPVIASLAFFVFFGFLDGLFWGSALRKVPHGAWFPLGMGVVLCLMLLFWTWARGLEDAFDARHRHPLNEFLGMSEEKVETEGHSSGHEVSEIPTLRHRSSATRLRLVRGAVDLPRLPVFALFHNASASTLAGAPHAFSAFLSCYPALPQIVIFFNIRVVGVPHTIGDERFNVSRVKSFEGIYTATLRLGYRDSVDLRNVAGPIRDRIVMLEARDGPDSAKDIAAVVDTAIKNAVTHILPNFHCVGDQTGSSKIVNILRAFLIESIYRRIKLNFDDHDLMVFSPDQYAAYRFQR
ncbi:hypothetical protein RQP46_007410 [Phenoliferia psychrophenolica]